MRLVMLFSRFSKCQYNILNPLHLVYVANNQNWIVTARTHLELYYITTAYTLTRKHERSEKCITNVSTLTHKHEQSDSFLVYNYVHVSTLTRKHERSAGFVVYHYGIYIHAVSRKHVWIPGPGGGTSSSWQVFLINQTWHASLIIPR